MTLDELQQRAADNKLARLAALFDAVAICAAAEVIGPGAKATIGEHLGYSTRTVTQLAAMHDLPEDCIDLDAKPGMYWAAIQNAPEPVTTIRHALAEGWTTAGQVKEYLGIAKEKKPPLLVAEADITAGEGQLIVKSDKVHPEDGWPARAKVRVSEAGNDHKG
ncbi:MAG TPA: hypothetical protein VM223_13795 [Planctomycetota bacterium]|nr:hypothetical protein [Planctomycetota bacterium]